MSFAWAVDNDIRSSSRSSSSSPVRSYASIVDSAIRSSSASSEEACSDLVDESFEIYNFSPNWNGFFKSWQKRDILGRGSFATVYEGYTDDGFFFAVKEVALLIHGTQGRQRIFQLQQDISYLFQLRHDNIVQYLGADKDNDKLYIFAELTRGSLRSLYQKYYLRDSRVSVYTREILRGLKYLHDRSVVHGNIKSTNILVDLDGFIKLADFGLAKLIDLASASLWMAPEVVKSRNGGYDGLAADIWSLGCTVLEMLTRQLPYSNLEWVQALFRIGRGEPPSVPESLSTNAQDFILKCLQADPTKRPTAAQLLHHPFVKH